MHFSKTAFGSVARGSIKAQDAATVTDSNRTQGWIFRGILEISLSNLR